MSEVCEGTDVYGQPCTLEARTTRQETVFEQGKRNTYTYNLCTACAHEFDTAGWDAEDEAKQQY